MAETSVAALEPRLQRQVESARVAYGRGNFDYTLVLCRTILRERPGCFPVRKLHRDAALRLHHGSGSPFALELGRAVEEPAAMSPPTLPPAEPIRAVESSEAMIEGNPHDTGALRLLASAAMALGWRETTVFALESIREETPKDTANLVALGAAQLAAGRPDDAVASAEQALRLEPVSAPARQLLRGAALVRNRAR